MKRYIYISIAVVILNLPSIASASETDWTILLRAGNLSGSSWVGSAAMNMYGVTTSALTGSYADAGAATWVPATIGFYTTDTTYQYGTRKYYSYSSVTICTWHLKLKAGDSWNANQTFNLYYASPVEIPFYGLQLVNLSKGNVYRLINPATNGGTVADFYTFATGLTMDPGTESEWLLTTSLDFPDLPEPAGIISLVCGIVFLCKPICLITRANGKTDSVI